MPRHGRPCGTGEGIDTLTPGQRSATESFYSKGATVWVPGSDGSKGARVNSRSQLREW